LFSAHSRPKAGEENRFQLPSIRYSPIFGVFFNDFYLCFVGKVRSRAGHSGTRKRLFVDIRFMFIGRELLWFLFLIFRVIGRREARKSARFELVPFTKKIAK